MRASPNSARHWYFSQFSICFDKWKNDDGRSRQDHYDATSQNNVLSENAELSEVIKRALKHPVRACEIVFNNGLLQEV